METLKEDPECYMCAGGFKSYYVVWKPRHIDVGCKCVHLNAIIRFKSYYVVWKPKSEARP